MNRTSNQRLMDMDNGLMVTRGEGKKLKNKMLINKWINKIWREKAGRGIVSEMVGVAIVVTSFLVSHYTYNN